MDWDRMREEWQSRSAPPREGTVDRPGDVARLWQCIKRRDILETAVAVAMVVFFAAVAWPLWSGGLHVSAAFAAWLAVVCVFIPVRLARARARFPARESDMPLSRFMVQEREALRHQRHLLSTVLWWYVGPIVVGVLGLFIGIRGLHWHSLAYATLVLLVGFAIDRVNRAAVKRSIDPVIHSLDTQIQQLEEDDED